MGREEDEDQEHYSDTLKNKKTYFGRQKANNMCLSLMSSVVRHDSTAHMQYDNCMHDDNVHCCERLIQ